MKTLFILTVILVVGTIAIGVYALKSKMENQKAKKVLGISMGSFLLMMVGATVFMLSGYTSFASDTANAVAASSEGLKYIGAALSTGAACIGTGIAVASSGSAAIGEISEDESLLGKTIIFVGLSEGIAIYGLIISIMILG